MQERRKALFGELDRTGEDHLPLTDPNARVMVLRSAQCPTTCPSRPAACRSRGLLDQGGAPHGNDMLTSRVPPLSEITALTVRRE